MKLVKKAILGGLFISALGITSFLGINLAINFQGQKFVVEGFKEIPESQAVLILGAKVNKGTLSQMLKDRADTAIEIYSGGKAEKILISGDHGSKYYDEVNAVKNYLLSKGIPAEDIFTDYAGFDTYDSLYRAKEVFEVDSLIISTQDFHLRRAIYIGRQLGVEVYGFKADKNEYGDIREFEFRESFANIKAFFEVLLKVQPSYLGDSIPLTGDGRSSWDK